MSTRVRALAVTAGMLLGVPSIAFAAGLTLSSQKLTTFKSCALTAYPNSSTTDTDTYVDQLLQNSSSGGTATTISVDSSNGANRRIYIKFDLTKCNPSIPSTASVKLATLRLYVTTLAASCRTLDIFASTAAFSEASTKWNNQPFGTTINNPASGSRTDAIQVGTTPCANSTLNAYVTGWSVTTDVANFVAGTSTNNGWMIRDDTENSAVAQLNTFSAREQNTLAQAPQLIVTYTT
jgi:hypothetical protein